MELVYRHERGGVYHVECGSCGDRGLLPFDILRTLPRQRHGNHAPESQGFFDERAHVGDFLFDQTLFPCVAVGIRFLDLGVGMFLDFSSMGG